MNPMVATVSVLECLVQRAHDFFRLFLPLFLYYLGYEELVEIYRAANYTKSNVVRQ